MIEWRAVMGYEGLYEVSNLGGVRSLDRLVVYANGRKHHHRGRELFQETIDTGYQRVVLHKAGAKRRYLVQHLVLESFACPRPEGKQALHFDDNKGNNSIDNLYWGTFADNAIDRVRNNRQCKGESRPKAKLNDFKVRVVDSLLSLSVPVVRIARLFKVNHVVIYGIRDRKRWKHVFV